MSRLTKEDFYYGALLSTLITNKLRPLVLFEETQKRKIFDITVNDYNCIIFSKYSAKPCSEKEKRWQFVYSKEDADKIKSLIGNNTVLLGFICGEEQLKDSQIAILNLSDISSHIMDFLDNKFKITLLSPYKTNTYDITIKSYRDDLDTYAVKPAKEVGTILAKIKKNQFNFETERLQ